MLFQVSVMLNPVQCWRSALCKCSYFMARFLSQWHRFFRCLAACKSCCMSVKIEHVMFNWILKGSIHLTCVCNLCFDGNLSTSNLLVIARKSFWQSDDIDRVLIFCSAKISLVQMRHCSQMFYRVSRRFIVKTVNQNIASCAEGDCTWSVHSESEAFTSHSRCSVPHRSGFHSTGAS